MRPNDASVFVASMKNVTNRFVHYGTASIANINLLKLIYKYAEYSQSYSVLRKLDEMVATLQQSDPDICMQINAYQGSPDYISLPPLVIEIGADNKAPTITPGAVTFDSERYTFSKGDFTIGYEDENGDNPDKIIIKSIPANGTLKYEGLFVSPGDVITDASLLVYERSVNTPYSTGFNFSVTDDNVQLPLESNTVAMSLTVEELLIVIDNEPATIGDRAQYAGNRAVTVFTIEDFTTKAILPYFDPESNDLDAIRIDEISTANRGKYFFFGTEVVEGQIITATELMSGAFYHEAPNENPISTDSFNASVRDNGSMIWVQ